MHRVLKIRTAYFIEGAWMSVAREIDYPLEVDPDTGTTVLSATLDVLETALMEHDQSDGANEGDEGGEGEDDGTDE